MSDLRLLDTLSGETRPLVPLDGKTVRIYSCGPTVYGPAHIGNFRSFLFADLLVRYLRWRGYQVRWVMNITDIDDKIIKGADAAGETTRALADRYLARFLDDAETLRMTRPDVLPRATEHIEPIVGLIQTLMERGHAYRTDDGSIFFRIASWPSYGRLARLDPEQMRVGERVEADEYAKDDVRDFALWKAAKPGEPSWSTSIGKGRPGWHIECSAMSIEQLGPSFDIHTGGVDLIFPHHEDEIAQSEAATGQAFVRTWLHCAHLRSSGSKMAKSTGNIARVDDVLGSGVSPGRSDTRCSPSTTERDSTTRDDSLAAAAAALARLDTLVLALESYRQDGPGDPATSTAPFEGRVTGSLRHSTTTSTSRRRSLPCSISCGTSTVVSRRGRCRPTTRCERLTRCATSIVSWRSSRTRSRTLGPGLQTLLDQRAAARAARDWAASDRLRDELADRGVAVEDTRDGQRWRRIALTTRG